MMTFIQKLSVWAIPLIFAVTVHEVAHGWVAYRCGDPAAKMQGRLTLNPFKHIDLIGTILVPGLLLWLGGMGFGWAKPVPIDSRQLRNPRSAIALISIAGPASNLLMAILWIAAIKAGSALVERGVSWGLPITLMGQAGVMINLVLACINLIPIPPLDGGHFVSTLLPRRFARYYKNLEAYGLLIVLILLSTGVVDRWLQPILRTAQTLFLQ